jgi:peptidyl-prolyl cis-trans isomerase D
MSIIQTIRDRGAKVSVVLIALALLGFILTDFVASKNRGGFNGPGGTSVGSVNGNDIGFDEFNKKVTQSEDYMKQQGYPQGPATSQMAIENTWNQEITNKLLSAEFDKTGMKIGKKELGDILYGANAPEDLKKQFTDQATGQYNPVQAKQQIDQMLKKGTAEQKSSFSGYITSLEQMRLGDKFTSLFSNSTNIPRWFVEKQNAENSLQAKVSLVRANYSDPMIPDSTIKISDDEIASYISKHKDDFKQNESRSISYVKFSAAPSASDSIDTRNKTLALKETFQSTTNIKQFLASEGVVDFYDGYKSGASIQASKKDSIFKTPSGSIYGPYLDGKDYVLAKLLGAKKIPDSVNLRHILIAIEQRDPQSGQTQQIRDTASARKLADSIQTAIRKGSKFDSVCAKLSEDPGSKDKGGVYEKVYAGQMVAAFNDFIFLNPTGTKGVVKTEFGYHYIEVLSQKGSSMGYKIAFLPQEIVASQETDNKANNDANQFAGDCRDQKTFDTSYERNLRAKGLIKAPAMGIKPSDANIQGLGASRIFVKNIYDAKKGEVLKPERVEDSYVVAVVTEVFEEGTQSVALARPSVESILRNKKKAALLKEKVGKITTLEAAAVALGGKLVESLDSIRISTKTQPSSLGYEPKVLGAIFNAANNGKLIPEVIEGANSVFVVRVDNVSATAVANSNVAEQRKSQAIQAKQMASNQQSPNHPLTGLRKAATIKDKRAARY